MSLQPLERAASSFQEEALIQTIITSVLIGIAVGITTGVTFSVIRNRWGNR